MFVTELLADSMRGLLLAATQIEADAPRAEQLKEIVERGAFRPGEDEAIGFWFARVLTTRDNLRGIIEELLTDLDKPTRKLKDSELPFFLIGYAAACTLVRIDRLLLFDIGHHSIIQRKLNEAFPEYRIPPKQYTKIYSWFVDHSNAVAMLDAMKFARKKRRALLKLKRDPDVGFLAANLREIEAPLDPRKRTYIKRAWEYVSHKWRRRGVVSVQKLLAATMEGFGRTASEIYDSENKNVSDAIRRSIGEFLQPGDVIVTRHARALTNLFLPGFWPHAALYIGTPGQRAAMGISADCGNESFWAPDVCTLEARKDGVKFRPLTDTLAVDMFAILRPNVGPATIREAIEKVVVHEGKKYNFDFDFFTSDRMVCTEVVYRAYDGLQDLVFPLQERAGRKTFSAEDLLDFALDGGAFSPVAIFGVAGSENEITYGDNVRELLVRSFRSDPSHVH